VRSLAQQSVDFGSFETVFGSRKIKVSENLDMHMDAASLIPTAPRSKFEHCVNNFDATLAASQAPRVRRPRKILALASRGKSFAKRA
jgi:hypothetical protein